MSCRVLVQLVVQDLLMPSCHRVVLGAGGFIFYTVENRILCDMRFESSAIYKGTAKFPKTVTTGPRSYIWYVPGALVCY